MERGWSLGCNVVNERSYRCYDLLYVLSRLHRVNINGLLSAVPYNIMPVGLVVILYDSVCGACLCDWVDQTVSVIDRVPLTVELKYCIAPRCKLPNMSPPGPHQQNLALQEPCQ